MTDRALRVEMVPVAGLVPYARNSRTHSPEQISAIAASIREFGFTNPVLVDPEGGIVAGHGRVLAAIELGMGDGPGLRLGGLPATQRRAYGIADNRLAERAGWDDRLLGEELRDLRDGGFDLGLLGFEAGEALALIAGLDAHGGLTDPDDAPPVQDEAVSVLGDAWILGRHRIVCGDCTDSETVAVALSGVTPHLMVTDPPYGVKYDPSWRRKAGIGSAGAAEGKVLNDDRADWREAWALFPGSVAYVWHAGIYSDTVAASLRSCKFGIRAQIVWVKTRHVLSRGHYHAQHEPALYGVREGADENWNFIPEHELTAYAVRDGSTGQWHGGRKQSTVWFIEHLKSGTGHGTQKPVECMKRPIINNSSAGQAVYEPFSGSGTTIIAAEMTGRSCHALELNPAYVDMAVRRWQNFTGGGAILESSGRAFADVEAERAAGGSGK